MSVLFTGQCDYKLVNITKIHIIECAPDNLSNQHLVCARIHTHKPHGGQT